MTSELEGWLQLEFWAAGTFGMSYTFYAIHKLDYCLFVVMAATCVLYDHRKRAYFFYRLCYRLKRLLRSFDFQR